MRAVSPRFLMPPILRGERRTARIEWEGNVWREPARHGGGLASHVNALRIGRNSSSLETPRLCLVFEAGGSAGLIRRDRNQANATRPMVSS
jgi:hypothetical protein